MAGGSSMVRSHLEAFCSFLQMGIAAGAYLALFVVIFAIAEVVAESLSGQITATGSKEAMWLGADMPWTATCGGEVGPLSQDSLCFRANYESNQVPKKRPGMGRPAMDLDLDWKRKFPVGRGPVNAARGACHNAFPAFLFGCPQALS
ncbi:hypothetical protein B0H13DRAFT_2403738 [Mycena leptocephala]|nr:hypothetical protein B0H13DRAFT_2403738 [Mycena leptocephala]